LRLEEARFRPDRLFGLLKRQPVVIGELGDGSPAKNRRNTSSVRMPVRR
jgi:hypothetical protein